MAIRRSFMFCLLGERNIYALALSVRKNGGSAEKQNK
jgi:hypothetical protein